MKEKLQYDFFTTNEIKPKGWLKTQLRIQADGLAGNLDKVWNDVKDSAWIGGTNEGWERVPYWLDGFIPLAYLLDDEDLKARAKKYMDAIIASQRPDGWICPCSDEARANYDTWAAILISKVLVVYADCSKDERVQDVLLKLFKNFDDHTNLHTLRIWGAARWFEALIALRWLYNRTGEKWLIRVAKKFRVEGFDWNVIFEDGFVDEGTAPWDLFCHGVNIGMAFKSKALMSLMFQNVTEDFAESTFKYLEEHHGMPNGHYTSDETLHGTSPIHGTELCSVVEAMYSYEWLYAATGNTIWADRLEALAFNALPATVTPDMWAHQYDQMSNQVCCTPLKETHFRSNDIEAHVFGLEPHFGCCTANMGQGFPKFALSTFMKTENGIATCAIAPAKLNTQINGTGVTVELDTSYPFRNTATYTVTTDKPVSFTFRMRVPGCAVSAKINGKDVTPGGFADFTQEFSGTQTFTLTMEFKAQINNRPDGLVYVSRGPLTYSVAIGEKWETVEYVKNGIERKFPYCDYYITPTTKWNYALADDVFEVKENDFTAAFDTKNVPIEMTARMVEIEWGFDGGKCDKLPTSTKPQSDVQNVRLIPYGCTNLRLTEYPYIKK